MTVLPSVDGYKRVAVGRILKKVKACVVHVAHLTSCAGPFCVLNKFEPNLVQTIFDPASFYELAGSKVV